MRLAELKAALRRRQVSARSAITARLTMRFRVGALNLPPVVRLVLVVEVSDSGDVWRMAVYSGPMRCRLLGSE